MYVYMSISCVEIVYRYWRFRKQYTVISKPVGMDSTLDWRAFFKGGWLLGYGFIAQFGIQSNDSNSIWDILEISDYSASVRAVYYSEPVSSGEQLGNRGEWDECQTGCLFPAGGVTFTSWVTYPGCSLATGHPGNWRITGLRGENPVTNSWAVCKRSSTGPILQMYSIAPHNSLCDYVQADQVLRGKWKVLVFLHGGKTINLTASSWVMLG